AVAEGILDYVAREMIDTSVGFYSTQDADSEGHEGKFFVWEAGEVREILGDDAPLFSEYYDITEAGDFEGKNILNITRSITEVAREHNLGLDELKQLLQRTRQKLFAVRETRAKPDRHEKILTAWNGLMLVSTA